MNKAFMKVFISWSGDRSKAVAKILDDWLQCVLQAVEPWMSSSAIDPGSVWFSEISDQLADTAIGIVCLTQENKEKPWILFEAGALAKGLTTSKVCTLLVDLSSAEVGNPLAQFNHTTPDRDGLLKLLRTINVALGPSHALTDTVIEKVFETYWGGLEADLAKAISSNASSEPAQPRTEENMLSEILTSVRGIDRRLREVESNRSPNIVRRATDGFTGLNDLINEATPACSVVSTIDQLIAAAPDANAQ